MPKRTRLHPSPAVPSDRAPATPEPVLPLASATAIRPRSGTRLTTATGPTADGAPTPPPRTADERRAAKLLATEAALLAALERVFAGTADPAYRAITKEHVALEAGLSRATIYRHPSVIAAFDQRLADAQSAVDARHPDIVIARLREQLAKARTESATRIRELETLNAAMAREMALLHAAMRQPTDTRVMPISAPRRRP